VFISETHRNLCPLFMKGMGEGSDKHGKMVVGKHLMHKKHFET
jgi:hypothetical protein